MEIEEKIAELGLSLPEKPSPAGNYLPSIRVDNLLYTAGMICVCGGRMTHMGKVGKEITLEEAYTGAQVCALNLLATIKGETGSLDAVEHFVTVTGFVNAEADFEQSPQVINGASDLFTKLYGERGRHARAAVTVACLPFNSTVEIQGVIKLKSEN